MRIRILSVIIPWMMVLLSSCMIARKDSSNREFESFQDYLKVSKNTESYDSTFSSSRKALVILEKKKPQKNEAFVPESSIELVDSLEKAGFHVSVRFRTSFRGGMAAILESFEANSIDILVMDRFLNPKIMHINNVVMSANEIKKESFKLLKKDGTLFLKTCPSNRQKNKQKFSTLQQCIGAELACHIGRDVVAPLRISPSMKFTALNTEKPQARFSNGDYRVPSKRFRCQAWEYEDGLSIDLRSKTFLDLKLFTAAYHGQTETFKNLLKQKADFNKGTFSGWTPIHSAASNGYLEILKTLIENKADINKVTTDGMTPIHLAVSKGHLEIFKTLMRAKADFNYANKEGWAPLHSAVGQGHLDILKALIKEKVDLNQRNLGAWTPLNIAANNGHFEIVKTLLKEKVDLNKANSSNWTPLNSAASNGHLKIVKALIKAKADLDKANVAGWTAVHNAAAAGHTQIVKALIKAKADLNRPGLTGWTPLHSASSNGHLEIVKALLASKADINGKTSKGLTARMLAEKKGYGEIVKALTGDS